MSARLRLRAFRTALVLIVVPGLLLLAAPPAVSPALSPAGVTTAAIDDVPIFPVSQLRAGMIARGLTTLRGNTIVPFNLRVMAVLQDGILPGIDMILMEGFGSVIEQNGGISFGMSGSPVYIGNRLVGAVAFGACCSGDILRLAGITPAHAMLDVLRFPTKLSSVAARWPKTVRLPSSVQSAIRSAMGATTGELHELAVPITVSGIRRNRLAMLREKLDPEGRFEFQLSSSGSRPQKGQTPVALPPGSNYAAVLSYGDLSLAGIGTTTLRVGGRSVAWGHPFFLSGPTRMGLNGARNLGVLKSGFFPTEELLAVGGFHGVVTQDRFTGIAGTQGLIPKLVSIRNFVTNTDIDRTFQGASWAAAGVPFFGIPDIAFTAWLGQLDRSLLKIGEGSANLTWRIKGTRAGGASFTFTRSNLFYDEFDISFFSLFESLFNMFAIQDNGFEPVKFTSVRLTGKIDERKRFRDIVQVAVTAPSAGFPVTEGPIFAMPGETLTVEVTLKKPGGGTELRTMQVLVPDFAGGTMSLIVRGGSSGGFFGGEVAEPAPAVSAAAPQSLDELLDQLKSADHNNDLVAELSVFFEDEFGGFQEILDKQVLPQQTVVRGSFFFDVFVGGGEEPPVEPIPGP